jgi:hypothetical protein
MRSDNLTECKYFKNCLAFSSDVHLEKPMGVIESYHKRYCKKNPTNCARFMIIEKLGSKYVSDGLLPTEKDKAFQIINNN